MDPGHLAVTWTLAMWLSPGPWPCGCHLDPRHAHVPAEVPLLVRPLLQPLARDILQPLVGDILQPLAGDILQPLAGDILQPLAGDIL